MTPEARTASSETCTDFSNWTCLALGAISQTSCMHSLPIPSAGTLLVYIMHSKGRHGGHRICIFPCFSKVLELASTLHLAGQAAISMLTKGRRPRRGTMILGHTSPAESYNDLAGQKEAPHRYSVHALTTASLLLLSRGDSTISLWKRGSSSPGCTGDTLTVPVALMSTYATSPSASSPPRMASDRGSSTILVIARLSGRAPYSCKVRILIRASRSDRSISDCHC